MANGLDYLPPGTTYADLDARCESRELTEAEAREERLSDPVRHGLCVDCARAGRESPAIPDVERCEKCLAESVAYPLAVVDLLREIARDGLQGTAKERREILTLVWPLVGDVRAWMERRDGSAS